MYFATLRPRARRTASRVAHTLPFPFVPATWSVRMPPVRIAQRREEGLDALQVQLPLSRGAREQEVECFAVAATGQELAHPVAAGLPLMCRRSWPTVRFS